MKNSNMKIMKWNDNNDENMKYEMKMKIMI